MRWPVIIVLASTLAFGARAFATAVQPPSGTSNGAGAGTVMINGFNNATSATVHFDNGGGQSSTVDALLSQLNVTYHNSDSSVATFNTFCIDLFHTVVAGQSYTVAIRTDLGTAFSNGDRIGHILEAFGTANLSANALQAAAVQIALWDLSLGNHTPTSFTQDADGTYSSGDPGVFSVDFDSNPDAASIASLVNDYLQQSFSGSIQGGWLDGAAPTNPGQSLLIPPPYHPVPSPLPPFTENVDLAPSQAPEPGTAALLGAALLALIAARRRQLQG